MIKEYLLTATLLSSNSFIQPYIAQADGLSVNMEPQSRNREVPEQPTDNTFYEISPIARLHDEKATESILEGLILKVVEEH